MGTVLCFLLAVAPLISASLPIVEVNIPLVPDPQLAFALFRARSTVTSIFSGMGVRVEWASAKAHPAGCSRTPTRIKILIAMAQNAAAGFSQDSLAFATPFSPSGPCITIFGDRLIAEARLNPEGTQRLIGLVLAHEIAHVIEAKAAHSQNGLLKRRWSLDDIKQMEQNIPVFSAEETASILKGIRIAPAVWTRSDEEASDRIYQAIRNDDVGSLRRLINPETVDLRDRHGSTPLMYAAAIGSAKAVQLLLKASADPNQKNAFEATALIWAGGEMPKLRLLLSAGADVNASSRIGGTALLAAARRDGGDEPVKLLTAKGADISSADRAGITPLEAAATANDLKSMRFLLGHGADARARDQVGFSPLCMAAMNGNAAAVAMLLNSRADPNSTTEKVLETVKNGPFSIGLIRPLHEAAAAGNAHAVRALTDFGAEANARELRGMTPLMFAVSTDHPDLETIRLLLKKGADPHARSVDGEDAIDWARKFRDPAVLGLLSVPTDNTPSDARDISLSVSPAGGSVKESLQRSIGLLQRTSESFLREGGCFSCHAQSLTGMAVRLARASGIRVDDRMDSEMTRGVQAFRGSEEQALLQLSDPRGGQGALMYTLLQMRAGGAPPGRFTDAAVRYLAAVQRQDGRWSDPGDPRPPIEDGDFSTTAMGIRSLRVYGIPARKTEFDRRIARAAAWLRRERPASTSDRAFQLLGLEWAGEAVPQNRVKELMAQERLDGGWAQTPYLASDAYATGQVLYVLGELNSLSKSATCGKGVRYLLRTQEQDGSWHVHSRAIGFQPYFESGFPHGHDQWISSAGTAWAAVALASCAGEREGSVKTPGP